MKGSAFLDAFHMLPALPPVLHLWERERELVLASIGSYGIFSSNKYLLWETTILNVCDIMKVFEDDGLMKLLPV